MDIEIKNCNNIDSAKITIDERKLNIKYAPNGTGKSTIAKAIVRGTAEGSNLKELLPFKLRNSNPNNLIPEISGVDSVRNSMCFNEDYVSQFVFKPAELLRDSFDVFIRTDIYRQIEQDIEKLIEEIKGLFLDNQELETLIANLKELAEAFKLTKSGISKASLGMKGLARGNNIQHIPAGLEAYRPFIQSRNSVGWVDWQTKGYEFAELSDSCPFCTTHVADKKEQIRRVGQEYDKNTIKNLVAIIDVIDRLGEYFSEDTKSELTKITALKDGIGREHENILVYVKSQIDAFVGKLEQLRTLSGFHFKDGEMVAEKLPTYKLDLEYIAPLRSLKTQEAINPINKSLDEMITKASELQGKINRQRSEMQKVIQKHQKDINGFLAYAGYSYRVEIVGKDEQAQLKLLHLDHKQHLSGGDQYLSFGERNAFAIVLFMYECLSKKPDLIILDDPISSFDKNKKYAILEMLFRRDSASCLKNKTVLMLTHDIEPIIDTVKSLYHKFNNQTSAFFLRMVDGKISEQLISRDDIKTFVQINDDALNSGKPDIVKLIYLRRYFEIVDGAGDAYQVLSNVLHKRERAIDSRELKDPTGNHPEMDGDKFLKGCEKIKSFFDGFSYSGIQAEITNMDRLKALYHASDNGYEKLQLFRLLELDVGNSVIQKFINETYHIENEFICQLDPSVFDFIPEYVINECNKVVT
ncbi:MAG: AAA family ATPase [Deltaproteobacteria bacterium]|nr:AAA family ATPase [Deltaproteobacteria bacterium]